MSSSTSYYDDPEFKRVLRRYEEACADGQHVYLDADDFADIVDYYLSRDRLDEADACVTYALTLHPDHTRLLVQLAKKYIDEGNIQEAQNVEASIHDAEDYNAKLLHAEILLYNLSLKRPTAILAKVSRRWATWKISTMCSTWRPCFLTTSSPNGRLPGWPN